MLTILTGLATIALIVGMFYTVGRLVDAQDRPIETGMKLIVILGWILLISYGVGWIVLEITTEII